MQRVNKHISLLKVFTTATLLGVYVLASVFSNLHHYFHHDHQLETCSAEAEKDPCHIKIFHHNAEKGCKHQTHVYSLENKCELCDAILAKYYFPLEKKNDTLANTPNREVAFFEKQQFYNVAVISIRLRGPPSSSFTV